DATDRDVQNGTGRFMSWEGWIGGWPGFPWALGNSAGGAVGVRMTFSASLNRRAQFRTSLSRPHAMLKDLHVDGTYTRSHSRQLPHDGVGRRACLAADSSGRYL